MPLLEHLRELRSRLIRAVIAMVLGSIVCFIFYENIIEALIEPVCDSGAKGVAAGDCGALVVTGVVGPLSLQLKVALYGGLIATAPLWLYQLWAFLAPGLHRREKKWAYLFVGFGAPLFAVGATLAYIMLPVAVRILLGFAPGDLANQVPLNEYIDFVLRFMIVFGARVRAAADPRDHEHRRRGDLEADPVVVAADDLRHRGVRRDRDPDAGPVLDARADDTRWRCSTASPSSSRPSWTSGSASRERVADR